MVADGAYSHKIDYVKFLKEILNLEGHPNRIIGQKVMAILLNGGFFPLVELYREGSAPAACSRLVLTDTRMCYYILSVSVAYRFWYFFVYPFHRHPLFPFL